MGLEDLGHERGPGDPPGASRPPRAGVRRVARSGEPGTLDGHRRGRRRYRPRRQSGREVSHRHAAPGRRRRALGRIPGDRASLAPLLHLAVGQYRPPAHRGYGGARGPRRQHRVDPDPPPAPAQPAGRTPQGLDSDCRGTRADAHIVTETNATGARRGLFLTLSALLFVASAAGTILWSRAMAEGMAMPGGWTVSMAWMPMPGETRLAAAAGFLAMWVAMMGAMMMPSLVPTLARDRPALESPSPALAGAGYFAVWAVMGAGVYVVGTVLVAAELRWPALAPAMPI